MKICVFSIPEINPGKYNIKDSRLDQVDSITKSKKKTYLQIEAVGEEAALESDAILIIKDTRTDLILKDLEFVETRLSRTEDEGEKIVLNKFKAALEKEEFILAVTLSEDEKKSIAALGLYTIKPVVVAGKEIGR